MKLLGMLAALVLLPCYAFAQVAPTFTLDGKLYSDVAGTTPLAQAGVVLTVQVLDSTQTYQSRMVRMVMF